MLPNQKRAIILAQTEIEEFDFMGVFELFEDEELSTEDVEEILGYAQELSIYVPESWYDN